MTFDASGLYLEDPPRDGRPALRCPRPVSEVFPETVAALSRLPASDARALALEISAVILRARVPEGEARDGVRGEDPPPMTYTANGRLRRG